MGAKLLIQSTNAEPIEVRIGNTATIGRTKENTVCLNTSPLVSRQHALIRCHNSYQYQVIDLGSRNGTYVNDARVVVPVTLEVGARIRIADSTLTFLMDDPEEGDEDAALTVALTSIGSASMVSRPVALLVCDIRRFSHMSERLPAEEVAQILGAWFRETGNLVQRSGGTVDKFMGDAFFAYWAGLGTAAPDCGAAFDIGRRLLALAETRNWPNGDPLRLAVALHFGRVTCSNVGLSSERDATIIGDAVNTLFRLESVAKDLGQPLILSQEFVSELVAPPPLHDFGPQALKGKTQTVQVFGLAG